MANRTHLGDRRSGLRFQISGQLWASIEMRHDAVLRDITPGGALLEVRLSHGERSIRAGLLQLPHGGPEVMVQVRHMSPMTDSPADDRHLLGVEFVGVTSAERQAISACLHGLTQREGRLSPTD